MQMPHSSKHSILVTLVRLLLFAVSTALAFIIGYGIFEYISGRSELSAAKSELEREGILRPLHEVAKPASEAELENGRKLLASLKGLEALGRTYSSTYEGLKLMQFVRPGVAAATITEVEPILWESEKDAPKSWEDFERELESSKEILKDARGILGSRAVLEISHSLKIENDYGQSQALLPWLRSKAIVKFRKGDISEAIATLRDYRRAVEFINEANTPVNAVMEMGQWSYGLLPVCWEALQLEFLKGEDLKLLGEILSGESFPKKVVRGLELEIARLPSVYAETRDLIGGEYSLDSYKSPESIPGGKLALKVRNFLWPIIWHQKDEARGLLGLGDAIELSRELEREKSWTRFKSRLEDLKNPPSNFNLWRFPLSESYPAEPIAYDTMRAAVFVESYRQQLLTTIALKRYRNKNTAYPESLAQLVPDYLPSSPIDWHDGKPLKYRLLDNGDFLLYSVNDDGIDQGGDPTLAKEAETPNMRNGLDFVLPRVQSR